MGWIVAGATAPIATGLDGKVSLSWANVPGASGYDIARGTASGATSFLTHVGAEPFLDEAVEAETSDYHTVTATNDFDPGPASGEVSAMPYSLDLWHQRHNAQVLRAVAAGGGVSVATGDGLRTLTSTDGMTWTDRQTAGAGRPTAIAHGAGTFVAVGTGGRIITSPDGFLWSAQDSGVTTHLYGIAYGG